VVGVDPFKFTSSVKVNGFEVNDGVVYRPVLGLCFFGGIEPRDKPALK